MMRRVRNQRDNACVPEVVLGDRGIARPGNVPYAEATVVFQLNEWLTSPRLSRTMALRCLRVS